MYKKKNYNNYRKNRPSRRYAKAKAWPVKRFATTYNSKPVMKTLDQNFSGGSASYTPDLLNPVAIPIYASGVVQAVNLAQQGTELSQRVGNKICMKSLRLRFQIITYQAIATPNYLRFMVLYDRQPNGNYPSPTDLLSTFKQDGTNEAGLYDSNINPNFMERFTNLYDVLQELPPIETSSDDPTQVAGATDQKTFCIDKYIKLKSLQTVFSGTDDPQTISDVQTGALLILVMGDQADNAWCLSGNVRLRFHDC